MNKRVISLTLLLSAVACGDFRSPTGEDGNTRSPFVGDESSGLRPRRAALRLSQVESAVSQVDPASIAGTTLIGFNDFPTTPTEHDAIVQLGGAAFAERFAGQVLSQSGPFDVLSGAPTGPLSLQVGAPGHNVHTLFDSPSQAQVIDGLGPGVIGEGETAIIVDKVGEGAIAVLFDTDISEFAFSIVGSDAGTATANFFSRDGSLLETIVLELPVSATATRFGFRRTNGIKDIAGVSIHNDDPGGIGYDDFTFDAREGETTQRVPADEQAHDVTVQENGKTVAGVTLEVAEDAIVTVRFVELNAGEKCHDYLMFQQGRCLEITAKSATNPALDAQLAADATVALCRDEDFSNPELFKFEERNGRAVPLEKVTPGFTLNCSDFDFASAPSKSWLGGLASRVVKGISDFVGPKPLYAVDRGMGGKVAEEDGFSFFVWASPIRFSGSVLAVDVKDSGKDAYAVAGTFSLVAKGFDPCPAEDGFRPLSNTTPPAGCENPYNVSVGFGLHHETIPVSAFKWVSLLKSWVYKAPSGTTTGILAMSISPSTGFFTFAGATPTEGVGTSPSPTYRPFSVQIGHRIQGGGLTCGVDSQYKCTLQH